jgi:hypothetical protein
VSTFLIQGRVCRRHAFGPVADGEVAGIASQTLRTCTYAHPVESQEQMYLLSCWVVGDPEQVLRSLAPDNKRYICEDGDPHG